MKNLKEFDIVFECGSSPLHYWVAKIAHGHYEVIKSHSTHGEVVRTFKYPENDGKALGDAIAACKTFANSLDFSIEGVKYERDSFSPSGILRLEFSDGKNYEWRGILNACPIDPESNWESSYVRYFGDLYIKEVSEALLRS